MIEPETKILVVEASGFFRNVIEKRLQSSLHVTILTARNMDLARQMVQEHGHSLFLCCTDLFLPDAPNGEIMDLILEHEIPSIVFTGLFSDRNREDIFTKPVIDYVTKESPDSLEYLTMLVRRVLLNAQSTAMVVDDSPSARRHVVDLLQLYRFRTIEAENGEEALGKLEEHPEIQLIITDYHMPKMDGFELVKRVRKRRSRSDLAIIGLSSSGGGTVSARFIKYGANDFLIKPFLREEFFCRVSQNMDNLDYIRELSEAATRDPLTGLFNRRFLFDTATALLAKGSSKGHRPAVALLDVDHFKMINDAYGHHVGDHVLSQMGQILRQRVPCDAGIVARIGGEEFCVVVRDMPTGAVDGFFDDLRLAVGAAEFAVPDGPILRVNLSLGLCAGGPADFPAMLKRADELLYVAKRTGRNRLVSDLGAPTAA